MDTKGNNVRLTEEAHRLLAEMAHDCDASMKDVASGVIVGVASRKQDDKRDDKRFAFGTFALGSIIGGLLMLFLGTLW